MKAIGGTLFLTFLLYACSSTKAPDGNKKMASDSVAKDSIAYPNSVANVLKTIPQNATPIFGYRFVVRGDFDGDGTMDTLTEHYISKRNNQEAPKFYDGLSDYDQLVALAIDKEPVSFVTADKQKIDTLFINSEGQLLGLSLLKNEGDLNGNGTDEISYVVQWADWSNLNTCHIMTYRDARWAELYSFPIWDWQIPDLPQTSNQYGIAGIDNIQIHANDTINQRMEKELTEFPGFIRKIRTNVIQVRCRSEIGDQDTIIVRLKE